jgi:hypothetical protein
MKICSGTIRGSLHYGKLTCRQIILREAVRTGNWRRASIVADQILRLVGYA